MESSSFSVSFLLPLGFFALISTFARCHLIDSEPNLNRVHEDALGFDSRHEDVKRPFGGGGMFSRSRPLGSRLVGGQSSPNTPPKFIARQEAKRRSESQRDDIEGPLESPYKRPFGPGIYARPAANKDKRPFGGSMVFSKPRGVTNSRYRYGIARDRRGTSDDGKEGAPFRWWLNHLAYQMKRQHLGDDGWQFGDEVGTNPELFGVLEELAKVDRLRQLHRTPKDEWQVNKEHGNDEENEDEADEHEEGFYRYDLPRTKLRNSEMDQEEFRNPDSEISHYPSLHDDKKRTTD